MASALAQIVGATARLSRPLGTRDWGYWIVAFVVLVISILASAYVDDYLGLVRVRYWLSQQVSQFSPRSLAPRFVKLVVIEDEEYWRGEPAGRKPINRDYLGKLVDALDGAGASVVALDFDVRLPDPNSPGTVGDFTEIPAEYRTETDALINAIARVANKRKIVLSKTIYEDDGGYRLGVDIYQPYGICSGFDTDGHWINPGTIEFPLTPVARHNISCGYIALPYDMRQLPPRLMLSSGEAIDSFAMSLARAVNPDIAAALGNGIHYGSYLPTSVIESYHAISPAGALLRGDRALAEAVNARAVIVGGQWHTSAYGVGDIVDRHMTPIGPITGAVIHENFAEAILDSRTYSYVPNWLLIALEVAFGVIAAIVFAYYSKVWVKLGFFALFFLGSLLIQSVMFLLLGTIFDASIPLFGLLVHSLAERIFEKHPDVDHSGVSTT
jgi:CHASE2 domain-containing sensor protein